MKKTSHYPRISSLSRGQSLIEFALILPILLMLAVLILDVGRIGYYYSMVFNAAREGARYAAVIEVNDPSTSHLSQITTVARQHVYGVPSSNVNVTVGKDTATETIWVEVSYNFHFIMPVEQFLYNNRTLLIRSKSYMFQER